MENRLGQEVLVTKAFTFGKSLFNKGYASASCPEFEIFCPPGQVKKEGITKGVNLPYQRLPQKFRNPWQSATCQEPAMCVNRRRLRSAQGRLVTSKKWQKMFAMGKEPRGMFEDAYNYYFRKTLQMHRNKVGYTMANSKGQKVLVTKLLGCMTGFQNREHSSSFSRLMNLLSLMVDPLKLSHRLLTLLVVLLQHLQLVLSHTS